MPINDQLLKILVCPEDKTPVAYASPELLSRINSAAAKGELRNRKGEPVTQAFKEALVRADGKVLYPIIDGIPVMMVDEGILV